MIFSWRTDLLEKTWRWKRLKAGGEGDDRGWGDWMASPTQWTWASELQELVMDREALRAALYGFTESRTWLSNWTELKLNALLEIIPPYQSTIVFHFLLFPNAILCHFLSLLPSNILYYITWPRQRRDYSGSFFSRSLFTGFTACVLCVSAADPWVFSAFTLSYWLHTDITLKSRWSNWTQKLVTGSKHLA